MSLVVQKYGGSSLATPERIQRVAARITTTHQRGARVLVVVSAMGGSTDELLQLALTIHPSPPKRELDMLLTAGERISMALLSMALERAGIAAISFTGSQSGIITDTRHAEARIIDIRGDRIQEALEEKRVVIVAGFQGVSAQREVTTLGRGGSDTTATALAAFFAAESCEICTDVDGVFTADPALVPQARKLHEITYNEMLVMATFGARVLHPRCVFVAQQFHVPLIVRSSFDDIPGTVILEKKAMEQTGVCALTHREDVCLLTWHCEVQETRSILAKWRDLGIGWLAFSATHTANRFCCLVSQNDLLHARDVLANVLEKSGQEETWECREEVSSITVVSRGTPSSSELYAQIEAFLEKSETAILHAQSTPLSVSIVVRRENLKKALITLHDAFALDSHSGGGQGQE